MTGSMGRAIWNARVIAVLMANVFSASMAVAQTAGASDAGNPAKSGSIGDIVVTAQKREERLINTPQSVSVVSSADIAKLNAVQLLDIANTIPGLSFSTGGAGTTHVTIRGVTVGSDLGSTVGFYVDDVPYGTTNGLGIGLEAGLFDLDRLEVLRGPQGTLYGASTLGGLVKYVTKRPNSHGFGGEAQAGLSATQHGGLNFNVAAAANVPVVQDKIAFRISGFESRDGGFIDNIARGQKNIGRSDTYGGRLDVLLTPTEPFSIRLTGFLQNINRNGEPTADFTATGNPLYGDLKQYRQVAEPFEGRYRLASATLNYDASHFSLTSITSYQTIDQDILWDVSAVYVPLLNSIFGPNYGSVAATDAERTKKFAQEVRISSRGSGALDWIVGGYYTHETYSEDEKFLLTNPSGQPIVNNLFTFRLPATYWELSGFANATWHITKKFDVSGGIRYAHASRGSSQIGTGLLGSSVPFASGSENVATYLANARYHFSDHVNAYFRFATGYRPGGPNFVTRNAQTGQPSGPPSFQADTLKSYELGLKGETEDRRFSFDLAGYHIDWSNVQVTFVSGGFAGVTNAPGGATVDGAEVSLTAHPIPPLTANVAMGYQHATLNEAIASIGGGKGDRLPNVPRYTATGNVDYAFADTGAIPTVGATVRYVGFRNSRFGAFPPNIRLPAYTIVDLRFALTALPTGAHPMKVQFFVHNLFDKRSELSQYYPQFGNRIAMGQPRTGGVQISTKF